MCIFFPCWHFPTFSVVAFLLWTSLSNLYDRVFYFSGMSMFGLILCVLVTLAACVNCEHVCVWVCAAMCVTSRLQLFAIAGLTGKKRWANQSSVTLCSREQSEHLMPGKQIRNRPKSTIIYISPEGKTLKTYV